jgi:hypothetical protein
VVGVNCVETLTLKASAWKILSFLFVLALVGAVGIGLIENQGIQEKHFLAVVMAVAGWWLTAISGIGLTLVSTMLVPGSSYLRLCSEGLETCSPFRRQMIKWQDIEAFGMSTEQEKTLSLFVRIKFKPSYPRSPWTAWVMAGNRQSIGYDSVVPGLYPMKAADLAALLEEWRSHYGS